MNIFKKVSAAALAAVVTTSCLTAVASAKDEQLKLLISPISEANGAHSLMNYIGGYYSPNGEGDDANKFLHIGKDELSEWQKTGKLMFTNVESELNVNGLTPWSGGFDNGYVQFAKKNEVGNIIERYVVRLDKAKNKISNAYTIDTLDEKWSYTRPDGYTMQTVSDDKAMNFIVSVYSPDGTKSEKAFSTIGWWACRYGATNYGKYVGYFLWATGETEESFLSYDFYAITKDGKFEKMYTSDNLYVENISVSSAGDNFFSWREDTAPCSFTYIYNADSGKTVSGNSSVNSFGVDLDCVYNNGNAPSRIDGVTGLYGNKFIAKCPIDYTVSPYEYRYILLEIGKNKFNAVSKIYKSISSKDGKIFLVQTEDDKWGYIDANGKELAIFDNASNFVGDYAPVVKEGKAYLIDKNMNCVSEKIDADKVETLDDELFQFTKDSKTYLATFAAPAPETSEPTSSETSGESTSSETSGETTSSETSSSTSDSTSGNPDTGAVGIGFIAGAAALCGAVVVLSRKKK